MITRDPVPAAPPRALRLDVFRKLQNAIWDGTLRPGEHLIETELAERFGVSRGPVREAIRMLEKQGLATSIPNRGSFVVLWGIEDVVEVFGVRRVLEGPAARLVARRNTGNVVTRLEDIVEEMRDHGERGDIARVLECEIAFHQALAESSGNRTLIRTLGDLSARIKMFIAAAEVRYRMYQDLSAIAATHQPILDAIRAGDPDLAQQCAEQHVQDASERLIERMLREALG